MSTDPTGDGIPRMSIEEFQQLGFLQEANRLFFHPRGLALEVFREDDGSVRMGGVWDYRSDPEGMFFADLSVPDAAEKAEAVEAERVSPSMAPQPRSRRSRRSLRSRRASNASPSVSRPSVEHSRRLRPSGLVRTSRCTPPSPPARPPA